MNPEIFDETGTLLRYLRCKSQLMLVVGLLGFAAQGSAGELSGCYVPNSGFAESVSISQTEQLGLYKIVLKREGWNELSQTERAEIQRTLVLSGPFRGILDTVTNTLAHVLSSDSRDGVLYTANDMFFPDENSTVCKLSGVETLNVVFGTGAYSDVFGSVQVQGTVNNCPGDPEFGLNDFEVVGDSGELCFY